MKKILIISYLFAPNNSIGSIRPTKLAKYFNKNGHYVDVVTADLNLNYNEYFANDLNYVNKLWAVNIKKSSKPFKEINFRNGITKNEINKNEYEKKKLGANKKINKIISWFGDRSKIVIFIKSSYRSLQSIKSSRIFVKNFMELINSKGFDNNEYDTVISTYGPIHSIQCGRLFKRHSSKVNWVCEFRDPLIIEDTSSIVKPYLFFAQNAACKQADALIAVSKGYLKRINRGRYTDKFNVIYNGFDEDDYFYSEDLINDDKFTLTYVGSLYDGKRDISTVFKALRELIDENDIEIENICFNYAGRDIKFLLPQVENYNLSSIIVSHGMLNRIDCLKLQLASRFLVLSTWNTKKDYGVVPGKFLEYMLINKPVISLVDGNLPNSEIRAIMDEANLGVTYEAACKDYDFLILKAYLKKEISRYKEGLIPNFNPNKDVIAKFDYRNIISEFEKLL